MQPRSSEEVPGKSGTKTPTNSSTRQLHGFTSTRYDTGHTHATHTRRSDDATGDVKPSRRDQRWTRAGGSGRRGMHKFESMRRPRSVGHSRRTRQSTSSSTLSRCLTTSLSATYRRHKSTNAHMVHMQYRCNSCTPQSRQSSHDKDQRTLGAFVPYQTSMSNRKARHLDGHSATARCSTPVL